MAFPVCYQKHILITIDPIFTNKKFHESFFNEKRKFMEMNFASRQIKTRLISVKIYLFNFYLNC